MFRMQRSKGELSRGDLLMVATDAVPEGGEYVIDLQGRVCKHGGGPVMGVVVGLLYLAGGLWISVEPATTEWWLWRPVWIAFLIAVLIPISLPLSLVERQGRSPDAKVPGAERQVLGALLLGLGIALLAMFGYGAGPIPDVVIGTLELDVGSLALVIAGAALSGLLPKLR